MNLLGIKITLPLLMVVGIGVWFLFFKDDTLQASPTGITGQTSFIKLKSGKTMKTTIVKNKPYIVDPGGIVYGSGRKIIRRITK